MYDTARQALVELGDSRVLERVALAVLRKLGHRMRITSPTGDLGRDAYGRPWFGEHDEIVLLASTEGAWSKKLTRDLKPYLERPRKNRPSKAVFATTQPTNEIAKEKRKAEKRRDTAADRGIDLEILDLNELAEELRTDELHRVAEYELGVRPRTRRPLRSVPEFRAYTALPGASAPLKGRSVEVAALGELLSRPAAPRAPVVLLSGPGGIGKTRLAVDVAADTARTVIAPTSVALNGEDLRDVPLNGRAVLIIDDAHRRPLAEIAALLSDPAYDQVAVILTLRPGFQAPVGRALGLESNQLTTLPLAPLSDEAIDAIVLDHGIEHESFRRHIRDLVNGNPLLAHAACSTALTQGHYTPSDTADILRSLVERRLIHLEERTAQATTDRRRATALAIATYAGARSCDRDAIAALRGSINTLPSDDDDLEQVLLDLEDAELIEDTSLGANTGPESYILRPDPAGPVLVADALSGKQRVRLRVDRVLRVLGRAAQFHPAASEPGQSFGALGLPTPLDKDEPELGLGLDVVSLAAQLSVLAQGAYLAGDGAVQALLVRAVEELLADDADIAVWTDVLSLAAQIAPSSPELIEWLHHRLVAQWPPGPDLFSEVHQDAAYYRGRIELLVKETTELVGRLAYTSGVSGVVSWLLDTAWLAAVAVPERAILLIGSGFSALTGTIHARAAESFQELFARRRTVLEAVVAWGETRSQHDPDGLQVDESGLRPPALAIRLELRALEPLLSLLTEELAPSLQDRESISWRNYVLPDTPATGELLSGAGSAVIVALDRLLDLPSDPAADPEAHAISAVISIARSPYTMLGENARGFGGANSPLPSYATELLTTRAAHLQRALVERWPRLPLAARYVATERSAAMLGGGSLARAVEQFDPVATRAVDDQDLRALLVVAPVDHLILDLPGGEEQAHTAAVEVGASSSLAEATEVLEALSSVPQSMLMDFRHVYGRAAGAAVPDAGPLLERLTQGRFPGDEWLLSGAAETHPEAVYDWLLKHVADHEDIAALTVAVGGFLPAAREETLLDVVFNKYVDTETGPPPNLVEVLASHLAVNHRGSFVQRLTRLSALGERASSDALDTVLRWIASALRRANDAGASPRAEHRELVEGLVFVIRRALALADGEAIPDGLRDHEGALGAVALLRDAPEQIAALLLERTTTHPQRPIPPAWRTLLGQAPAAVRRRGAAALQAQIDAAGDLPSEVHQAAVALIRLLDDQA